MSVSINMLLCLLSVYSEVLSQCDYPATDDFVITNYFRDKCGPCDRVTHFLDEIDSRLERNNAGLTFRYVDCGLCDCSKDNIEKVPTVTVSRNNKELDRFLGFQEFGDIVEFLVKNTQTDRHIFKKRIKSTPGKVVQLKDRDFLTAFDGPWLILFYKTKSDLKRELIEQIAEENEAHLNVGEISGQKVPDLLKRFSIPSLPALLAFHGGLLVGYNGKDEIEPLREFVTELIRPSFTSLTYEEFKTKTENIPRGEPVFIVFYKDLAAANDYFSSIAHEYKFRARIFKSNDPELLKAANVTVNDMALVVYRNGVFHPYTGDLSSKDAVFNWIFHAHYPSLTRVTNESIYMVLHGIKPVVLLLSDGNTLIGELEAMAQNLHAGNPFIDKVFAAIDTSEYSLFVPKMLPGIVLPTVVILDPNSGTFYAENVMVRQGQVTEYVDGLIQRYDEGKVREYPRKPTSYKKPAFAAFLICVIAVLLKKSIRPRMKIIH